MAIVPGGQRSLPSASVMRSMSAHRQPVPVIEVAVLGQRADLVQEAVHPGTHLPLARAGVDAAVEGHQRRPLAWNLTMPLTVSAVIIGSGPPR